MKPPMRDLASRSPARSLLILVVLFLYTMPSMTANAADFSDKLDTMWNFGKPAESETRFRAELAKYSPDSREALEITTQIARTQSLRRMFAEADATLDSIAEKLGAMPHRVRIRYLLERGRTRNSSGDKAAALPLFAEAATLSERDTDAGAGFYRVDALHMLGIAAPPSEQLDWNLKALSVAETATEKRTRDWAMALNHNIGWTYFEKGDVVTALAYWKKALALREAQGKPGPIRIAKWTIARGYRALGQLDEAEKIQMALVAETEKASEPDGYVYEELAEVALARGDEANAAAWASKAHALLKDDGYLQKNEAPRLARLKSLAAVTGK